MGDSPVPKSVLLFGATGVIGKDIVTALVDAKAHFEKIGIFTSVGTAESKKEALDGLKAQGIQVVVGDVTREEDVKAALADYDTVISALGRNVILAQILLLDIAEASPSIHTFYPSEYGTDIEYGPKSPKEPPHQLKLQVRKHIREHVSKLNITYLVTGPYSDLYIGKLASAPEAGSFDVREKKAVLCGTGDDKVSFTTMGDVGKLLVAALKTPQAEAVRTLKVNSFTATPHDILAEYEKQTGSKWHVSYTSLQDLEKYEKKAWEDKNPLATAFTLRRIWIEGGTLYDTRDNAKIGDPPLETLQEQVKKAIQKQTLGA